MIVRNIYLGAFPICQIYQNGKIIWNSLERIGILSNVEVSTYGKATLGVPVLFGLQGEGESNVNAMGIGNKYAIWGISGTSQSDTYGNSLVALAEMISTYANALSESDGDAIARLFEIISAESAAEETTEASAITTLFAIKSAESEVEVNSDTEAVAYAFTLVDMGKAEIPINTYASAIGYSWRFVSSIGQTESNTETLAEAHTLAPSPMDAEGIYLITYANAITNSIPFFNISGLGIVDTFGNAEVRALSSESIDAIAEIISKGSGNGRPLPTISGDGKCESANDGVGNLVLLYLPILENNVLTIPSAYEARVVDGVLEVI